MLSQIKLILLSTAFIAVTPMVHAEDINKSVSAFDGFYIGGGLGVLNANTHLERKILEPTNDPVRKASTRMGGYAPQINVFLGYGNIIWKKLYLGAEAKVSYTNYKGKYILDHIAEDTLEHHLKESYGIAGRLGWCVKDFALIYFKGGLVQTGMHLKAHDDRNSTSREEIKKNVLGYEFAVGIDFSVNKNLIIGGEVSHTRYHSMTTYSPSNPPLNRIRHYKIEPQTNVFMLKAAWKF